MSAPEIENVVLQAVGLEKTGLTSKEEEAAFRAAIRRVVFKATTGEIESEFQPGGSVAEHLDAEVFGKV